MYSITAIMAGFEAYPIWLAVKGKLGGPAILGGVAQKSHVEPASREYLTSLKFWQLFFHTAAVPFTGFGMKALSTTIFEAAYGTSFLDSSYLTALTLIMLMVVRGIFPLLSRRLPLLQLLAG